MNPRSTLTTMAVLAALASAAPATAANCAQVNKYLATGRSVQDVSETMVIPEDEVKKCQAEAGGAPGGAAAAPTPAAEAKPK